MRHLRFLLFAGFLLSSNPIQAGPLLPSLSSLPPGGIAGQSTLAPGVTLDWIVIEGAGYFNYYYELENTTAGGVQSFTVPGSFVAAGEFCCTLDLNFQDLDLFPFVFGALGHADIAFPNLGLPGAVESEVEIQIFGYPASSVVLGATGVTWNYTAFPGATDSQILFARSLQRPQYGSALLNGALASDPVPAPAPEPAAGLLVAIALAGMSARGWRSRRAR